MKSVVSKLPIVARIFLGLVFTVFGLNGFLNFLPSPEMNPEAGAFIGALAATGYMFPLLKGTEVIAGLMLLGNRYVPLALTLLAPVTVNILLFHVVLAPAPGMPLALIAAQVFLAYHYRDVFRPVLQAKAESGEAKESRRSSVGELSSQGA